jgi:hypothetical protein
VATDLEHQGHRLAQSVRASPHLERHTRAGPHIAIARAVNDHLGQHCLAPGLALDEHAADPIPVKNRLGEPAVISELNLGLGHHSFKHVFHGLDVEDVHAFANPGPALLQIVNQAINGPPLARVKQRVEQSGGPDTA